MILVSAVIAAVAGSSLDSAVRVTAERDTADLVAQLGSPEFGTRDRAARRLAGFGLLALPALKRAIVSDDPEVRTRAERVQRGLLRPYLSPRLTLRGDSHTIAVAVASDAGRVAAAGIGGIVYVWDAQSGRLERKVPAEQTVTDLAFAPDGKTLAVGGFKYLDFINTATGKLHRISARDDYSGLMFSPDGSRLLAATADRVELWEVSTGKQLRFARVASRPVGLAYHPGGRLFALSEFGVSGGRLAVWDTESFKPIWSREINTKSLRGVAFATDGKVLYAEEDGTVRVREATTGEPKRELRVVPGQFSQLWMLPDGRRLLTVGPRGLVGLWDAASGTHLWDYTRDNETVYFQARFSADGRTLAVAQAGVVRLWVVPPELVRHLFPGGRP